MNKKKTLKQIDEQVKKEYLVVTEVPLAEPREDLQRRIKYNKADS